MNMSFQEIVINNTYYYRIKTPEVKTGYYFDKKYAIKEFKQLEEKIKDFKNQEDCVKILECKKS